MARKSTSHPAGLQEFLALLQKSDLQDVPPSRLREDAGSLCQRLQHFPADLEKLMEAVAQGRHWEHLCSSPQVVRAGVLVHLRKNQHDLACRFLESCPAIKKENLVNLWYEIHYHEAMQKRHTTSLTPVQKHRCRKRNPPPASLCPGGVKNRNYPVEVRERLQRFAVEVTTTPNQEQREALACDTNLPPKSIYGWFANYRRRRQKPRPSQAARPGEAAERQRQRTGRWAGGLCGASGTEERKVTLPPADQQEVRQPHSPPEAPWWQSSSTQGRWPEALSLSQHRPAVVQAEETSDARFQVTEEEETEPDLGPSPSVLEVTWEPAGPGVSPGGEGSRAASKAVHKGVQCSLGSLGASCGCSCSRTQWILRTWPGGARMPKATGEVGSETVCEQADLQLEALVLQRQQLLGGPWPDSALPCSTFLKDPDSTKPYLLEENQAVPLAQVLWDPASNPFATDTIWAASLLCELSSGSSV